MEEVNNTIEIVKRIRKDINKVLNREMNSLVKLRKKLLEREISESKQE